MKRLLLFAAFLTINAGAPLSAFLDEDLLNFAQSPEARTAQLAVLTVVGSIKCGDEKLGPVQAGTTIDAAKQIALRALVGYLTFWQTTIAHEFGHYLAAQMLWNCQNQIELGSKTGTEPFGALEISNRLTVVLSSLFPYSGKCKTWHQGQSLFDSRLCIIIKCLAGPVAGICSEICSTYLINKLLYYLDRRERISISKWNIANQLINLLPFKNYDGDEALRALNECVRNP